MECHFNSHRFWGPGLGGTPPKNKWGGKRPLRREWGSGRLSRTWETPARSTLDSGHLCARLPAAKHSSLCCSTDFSFHPVLLQILSGVPVITTFSTVTIGRFQAAPGSQDNQGDRKTSSGIAVLVFLFFPFCWLNSASWPLQEIRPNWTLPASRAAGWKSARSDLAWANTEGQQSFDRTGQAMLQVCIWELSRSLWSPLLLA